MRHGNRSHLYLVQEQRGGIAGAQAASADVNVISAFFICALQIFSEGVCIWINVGLNFGLARLWKLSGQHSEMANPQIFII